MTIEATTTETSAGAPVGSKWLSGAYAPLHEEITAVDLPVIGTLPTELDGRYLRNGPNPIGEVDPATYHWFTGDGMVHGVRLRDGRAEWYRNRWVRSTRVSEALGEAPVPGERHGGMDGANTNVIGLAGKTFAIVEAGACPVELDDELTTVRHSDFDGTLPNGFSAHPKRDPATGSLHTIAYHWALPFLQYVVVGADGRVSQVEPIEVEGGPMVHDCSITERWMVVYDLPVTFDLDGAMQGRRFPYAWNAHRAARVGLLPLGGRGSDVRWFEVEPCYVFHPLNAYDDGTTVVLDVVRYGRMFDASPLGPDESTPHLWRWTLDTATGRVDERQLSDVPLEFPRVDERAVGRRHTTGWASGVRTVDEANDFGGQLVRIDGPSGDATGIDLGAGRLSGEWVMIPRAEDSTQDDGWLMSFVYDQAEDRTDLVVLAADDPAGGAVATVRLPVRVPLGFHGNWVPTT